MKWYVYLIKQCFSPGRSEYDKGQEISEWMYEVVELPKIWTKKLEKFYPEV